VTSLWIVVFSIKHYFYFLYVWMEMIIFYYRSKIVLLFISLVGHLVSKLFISLVGHLVPVVTSLCSAYVTAVVFCERTSS
jgi:hypothetical protein